MSVSKTHAQVEVAPDGSLLVMDRGSTNGTVVVRHGSSQRLVPGRPLALAHGDSILVGDRTLRVVREG
ncbi:MAG: FHA domain-containing protein [Nocardioides sp.]|nr:FHA domain-containing protein [Nocardioides sp.]